MSTDACAQLAAEHEALIQFLYLAPVGLVQTGIDGEIVMINPISAQLLMPLQRDGNLVNLFTRWKRGARAAPPVRAVRAPQRHGLRRPAHPPEHRHPRNARKPQVLSLTLLKLDGRA
jgi:hypothetical protein